MLMGLFYGRLLFVLLLHQDGYVVIGFHPTLIDPPRRRTFCDKRRRGTQVPSKHSLGAQKTALEGKTPWIRKETRHRKNRPI
jgi:hypothetical protein